VANLDVVDALNEIARQKNLDREFVIDTLKQGLMQACKKKFGSSDNIVVEVEDDTGEIGIFAKKKVVEEVADPALEISVEEARDYLDKPKPDDEVEIIIPFEEFGRIAIQTTKQILFQRIREAEREQVYREFSSKLGNIVSGTIQQISRGDVIVNLDNTESVMPYAEQIRSERYQQGRSVRALVIDVAKTVKGPQVILSRSHPDFLKRMFYQEVPEIREGLVEVKGAARDPGERAKVAVYSKENRVDPVGACVGLKGARVQAVVRELAGEKIDIVLWSPDPAVYVVRALAPANQLESYPADDENRMVVICSDDQYSLAIGKKGQNVRLAAKLTGWRIDVVAETEHLRRVEAINKISVGLDELDISDKLKDKLAKEGMDTAEKIIEAGDEGLTAISGIGDKTAEKILSAAKQAKDKQLMHFEQLAKENPAALGTVRTPAEQDQPATDQAPGIGEPAKKPEEQAPEAVGQPEDQDSKTSE
jgi:N utilization substance protein A